MVVDPLTPRTMIRSNRPAHGPVLVCIYKYTSRAGDLLPAYKDDQDVALYQAHFPRVLARYSESCSCISSLQGMHALCTEVQIEHEVARNGVAFKFKERFLQYLRAAHELDPTIPATFEALAEQAGIYVVVASGFDGMKNSVAVPWRSALYVAGDQGAVKNALLLLDGYFVRETRDEMPIHLHPHIGIDGIKDILEEMEYGHYELRDSARDLPLSVFDAMPPKERGIVVLNIQVQTEKQISIVVSGATYAFRQQRRAQTLL